MAGPFPSGRPSGYARPSGRARRGALTGCCPFCERNVLLTFHHLIPKKVHRRRHFKRHYSRELLARGVYVCRDCHDGIHDRFDEMLLAKRYNTPEALLADEALQRHFRWVARQRCAVLG